MSFFIPGRVKNSQKNTMYMWTLKGINDIINYHVLSESFVHLLL